MNKKEIRKEEKILVPITKELKDRFQERCGEDYTPMSVKINQLILNYLNNK